MKCLLYYVNKYGARQCDLWIGGAGDGEERRLDSCMESEVLNKCGLQKGQRNMIENIKQILKAYNRVRSSKEDDFFFLNYRKVFV